MRILLFTPPSDQKILDELKTMTARCWRQKPPAVDEVIRAQTGRKKETSFALLKVLNVREWNGRTIASAGFDYPSKEVAIKEGFESIDDFLFAYWNLNDWCWDDEKRKHWFIEFEMIDEFEYDHIGATINVLDN